VPWEGEGVSTCFVSSVDRDAQTTCVYMTKSAVFESIYILSLQKLTQSHSKPTRSIVFFTPRFFSLKLTISKKQKRSLWMDVVKHTLVFP
jgi:hypothetical protein